MTKSNDKVSKKRTKSQDVDQGLAIPFKNAAENISGNRLLDTGTIEKQYDAINKKAKIKTIKAPVKKDKPKGQLSLNDNASKKDLADTFHALVNHPKFSAEIVRLELLKLVASLSDVYQPSEYWAKRDKSLKETPVDFIKRVYKPVLDGFFTTTDLKASDSTLYTAFYTWRRDHNNNQSPSLKVFNLPTKDELSDWLIENPDELAKAIEKPKTFYGRAASRIDDAKYARAKKKKQHSVDQLQQHTSP